MYARTTRPVPSASASTLQRRSSHVHCVAFSATSAQVSMDFLCVRTWRRFLESVHILFVRRVEWEQKRQIWKIRIHTGWGLSPCVLRNPILLFCTLLKRSSAIAGQRNWAHSTRVVPNGRPAGMCKDDLYRNHYFSPYALPIKISEPVFFLLLGERLSLLASLTRRCRLSTLYATATSTFRAAKVSWSTPMVMSIFAACRCPTRLVSTLYKVCTPTPVLSARTTQHTVWLHTRCLLEQHLDR